MGATASGLARKSSQGGSRQVAQAERHTTFTDVLMNREYRYLVGMRAGLYKSIAHFSSKILANVPRSILVAFRGRNTNSDCVRGCEAVGIGECFSSTPSRWVKTRKKSR